MALHSGIGVVIRNVVSELANLYPGWRFTLLGVPAGWETVPVKGGRIAHVPMNAPIYSIAEQFELRRVAAGADVLWSPHYNAGVLTGIPLVVTVHDVTHLAIKEFTRLPHKRLYAELMYRTIAAKASTLVFVSDFSRREFERLVGKPKAKVVIAHNGVGEEWFSSSDATAPIEGDYMVFVGNVKPHKNLSGLIKAMALVRKQASVSLVVVGKTDGFITGDADASSELRQQPWVRVVEGASDTELRAIVAGARGLVFPSFYEGFGLPPLEAMAIGCPAIVSSAASIPEICGDAAVYFEPPDTDAMSRAILDVLGDPALRSRLVERGKSRARQFNWRSTATTVGRAIEDAAARR